jgi:NAD(P)H-dependent flavin oxidoreductase YrpB (nitropropane dioxygenase family)
MTRAVLKTPLCERLGIEYPIVLAGMGSRGAATPAELVAAVSEAGGLGVIGGSGLPAEELRSVIRKVRTITRKPIGVDLILPTSVAEAPPSRSAVRVALKEKFPEHYAFVRKLMAEHGLPDVIVENEFVVSAATGTGQKTPQEEQVDVIMEEDVQVFAAGLGDPSWIVPRARAKGMTVMGLVGNVRNAKRQIAAGVDIIVTQGYEAGGHTGKIANFPLIPQVVDAVRPVPVIAGGGIADGRGIAAALSLGAIGVWVGTAFLVADECAIPEISKEQIINGRSEDFEIARVYTGKTMRAYKNTIIEAWAKSGLAPLPMPYQKIMMDDFNESALAAGRWDLRSNPGGQIAGLITERKPARVIMEALVDGTVRTMRDLQKVEIAG